MNRRRTCLTLGLALAAAVAISSASAAASGVGFTWGDFRFAPAISDGLTYTNNVREDPSKAGDFRNDVLAMLDVRSLWKTNALGLNVQILNRSYFRITQQDNTLYNVVGDGRYDLSSHWHLSGAAKFLQNKISRSNPNSIPGAAQATATTVLGNAQLSYQGDTYGDHVVVNIKHLTFNAAILPNGQPVVQQDQNRLKYSVANYFSRKFSFWNTEPYLYVGFNQIKYDSTTYTAIRGRNSDGEKIGIGVNTEPAPGIKLEFTVGLLHQIYDDPAIGKVLDWFGSAGIDWAMTKRDHARLTFQRTFNEVVIPGAAGYFMNDLSMYFSHAFSEKYSVDIQPAYRYASVVRYPLNVTQYAGTIGLNDALTSKLVLRGQVFSSDNESNLAQFTYHETTATLQLTYQY